MKKDESPDEWMLFAEGDLELAMVGKISKKIRYETLCFHSQQAAEKAIKAILVFKKCKFPKTHNIKHLLDLVDKTGIDVPVKIKKSDQLTDYATESRYPGIYDPIERKEYKESLVLASKVLQWAKSIVDKPSDKLF
jgi:HEPN domain-containing protein